MLPSHPPRAGQPVPYRLCSPCVLAHPCSHTHYSLGSTPTTPRLLFKAPIMPGSNMRSIAADRHAVNVTSLLHAAQTQHSSYEPWQLSVEGKPCTLVKKAPWQPPVDRSPNKECYICHHSDFNSSSQPALNWSACPAVNNDNMAELCDCLT